MSSDETNDVTGNPTSSGGSDIRGARRAQREAERAGRAQRKADTARERALEAARAGGLFEGMEAMPRTGTPPADAPRSGSALAETPRADSTTSGPIVGDAGPMTRPADGGDADAAEARAPRRGLAPALAVVAVVLLAFTGLATWGYLSARENTAAEQAIAAAPQDATNAAQEITTQMFTYDHQTVDADLGAVRDKLTDPALSEFVERSMPTVASAAKQQEATVFATVAAAAAEEVVDADHVTVLVMLNRMVSTKEDPKAASSASRLRVDMVREDGQWKLGKLSSL